MSVLLIKSNSVLILNLMPFSSYAISGRDCYGQKDPLAGYSIPAAEHRYTTLRLTRIVICIVTPT